MSPVWINVADGVRLTLAQALALGEACEAFDDPVWHVNACGCCVAVHERDDDSRGYLIGQDGDGEWVEAGDHE